MNTCLEKNNEAVSFFNLRIRTLSNRKISFLKRLISITKDN